MIEGTIIAKPQAFAAAVAWAAKFVSPRPSVPVQGGMRFTAEDGTLTVETFNESVKAQAALEIEGDGEGSVIVSGRLIAELAKTFRGATVEITGEDDDVAVTSGRWSGTLPEMQETWAADTIVAPEPIGTVNGTALAAIVAQAGTAASDDEKKPPAYHCVHLVFDEKVMIAMATDGARLVRARAAFTADETEGGVLEATTLGHVLVDAAGAFAGPDEITVGLGPNLISLTSPTRSVVLTQMVLDGGYGPAKLVDSMFAEKLPRSVTVPVAKLLMPMKAANLIRGDKDGPVSVTIDEGVIAVKASATQIKQKGAEEVDVEYSGPAHTMALNPKFLADALSSAPGDTVAIAFNEADRVLANGARRPFHAVVTVPGNDTWQHMLMPIKLPGA